MNGEALVRVRSRLSRFAHLVAEDPDHPKADESVQTSVCGRRVVVHRDDRSLDTKRPCRGCFVPMLHEYRQIAASLRDAHERLAAVAGAVDPDAKVTIVGKIGAFVGWDDRDPA